MKSKVVNVLIAGAGQLGSRYLQGMMRCQFPLNLYVYDICTASLELAEQRWREVDDGRGIHSVIFNESLGEIPNQVDVAIVATIANVRSQVIGNILKVSVVRYWVLEKVLAQSESALDEIIAYTNGCCGAWVNTPRRMMPWYQNIKAHLNLTCPITLIVKGGLWGMACNAIHYFDLLSWLTGEHLEEVDTKGLDSNWCESKRQGVLEVSGVLIAKFSGGSYARLEAHEGAVFAPFELSDGHGLWTVDEAQGVAHHSNGTKIRGGLLYQSEMSASLVEGIIKIGRCELPSLTESVMLHRVFLGSMLNHWRQNGHLSANFVPIT